MISSQRVNENELLAGSYTRVQLMASHSKQWLAMRDMSKFILVVRLSIRMLSGGIRLGLSLKISVNFGSKMVL